jgi:hypothetical protein
MECENKCESLETDLFPFIHFDFLFAVTVRLGDFVNLRAFFHFSDGAAQNLASFSNLSTVERVSSN